MEDDLLAAIEKEKRKVAELKAIKRLVVVRGNERWELEVEDATPEEDGCGVRLRGKAKRIS